MKYFPNVDKWFRLDNWLTSGSLSDDVSCLDELDGEIYIVLLNTLLF